MDRHHIALIPEAIKRILSIDAQDSKTETSRMVQINRKKNDAKRTIFYAVVAIAAFVLMFAVSFLEPRLPVISSTASPSQSSGPPVLLSTPNTTDIQTDVRGNLGPPEVMLKGGTDWIKDRWQAASDMHGTAIKGHHQVLLTFHAPVQIDSIVLDWEAAFSKDYLMEGALISSSTSHVGSGQETPNKDHENLAWFTMHDSHQQEDAPSAHQTNDNFVLVSTEKLGKSPGVKFETPLHVVHTIARHNATSSAGLAATEPPTIQYLRLTIRSSAMGWGVSLWRIKVFGWTLPRTAT